MDLTKHEEQVIEAYRQQPEAVRQGIDRILSVKGGQTAAGTRETPRDAEQAKQDRILDIVAVLRDRNGTPVVCWHKVIERTIERKVDRT